MPDSIFPSDLWQHMLLGGAAPSAPRNILSAFDGSQAQPAPRTILQPYLDGTWDNPSAAAPAPQYSPGWATPDLTPRQSQFPNVTNGQPLLIPPPGQDSFGNPLPSQLPQQGVNAMPATVQAPVAVSPSFDITFDPEALGASNGGQYEPGWATLAPGGQLGLAQANDHFRNGGGNPAIVDASQYDLGGVNAKMFGNIGSHTYTFPAFRGWSPSQDYLVDGTVNLQKSPDNQSFQVLPDKYDFDMHPWLKQPMRNTATLAAHALADPTFNNGTPYDILFPGSRAFSPKR